MFPIGFRSACFAGALAVLGALTLFLGNRAAGDRPAESAALADRFLAALPAPSGLCVHLGVRDGDLAVALAGKGRFLVHGLATDPEAVERARKKIDAAGLAGVVSVEPGSPARLPYADGLVSLLVADNLADLLGQGFTVQEALRVLQPGGVAWLGQADARTLTEKQLRETLAQAGVKASEMEIVARDGLWAKVVKPRPATMDQWTHVRYDATANPVSTDKLVGVPTGVRWVAGPNWPTGNRKAAVPGVVSSANRLVYVFEDEPADASGLRVQNTLIARDPFNGLLLWKRRTARAPLPLVCVGQRVYTVVEDGGPLVALDADTGETVRTYENTRAPNRVLHIDGLLLVALTDGFGCLEAETGQVKWRLDSPPKSFVAGDGRVFVHADSSRRGGPSGVSCLDLKTGAVRWKKSTDDWAKGTWNILMVYNGVLLGGGTSGNQAIGGDDGQLLWSYKYPLIGHGGSFNKILCLGGLVWVHASGFEGMKQYAWEGLDPQTGKVVKRVVQPAGYSLKHRCSYDVATERYFVCGSMDFAEVETGQHEHFNAARKSCQMAGAIPANGLVYTFPHACGCYPMLRGFLGLAAEAELSAEDARLEGERLVKGPAFGQAPAAADAPEATSGDWPTYRRDPRRTSSTSASGPAELKELWSVDVLGKLPPSWSAEWDQKDGGRLSSPVVAGGLALVAAVDQHRLLAFDAQSGEPRWSFTAGGRIDCPPTVHGGLCLLGARDGWIYCLRARDGALAWRFRAAPADRHIVAYGQLESPWPVVGGVLVYDGLAYFVAGRHAGSNGGVFVGALEPETGRLVWAQRPDKYPGVPDVLNGEAGKVQMASWEFDAKSGANGPASEDRLRGGRLGLLNDAWYDRPIAMRKNLQLWTVDEAAGQMLAFNDQVTCVFSACTKVAGGDGKMSGHASLAGKPDRGREWTVKMPLGVRLHAMALASERLYVAGLLDDDKAAEADAHRVRSYALADGKLHSQASIAGAPVHDGLIVVGGRVYVATQTGKLICLGEK